MFLFRIAPAFCSGRIFAQYVFCILNLPPIKKFLGLSSPVQSVFNFFKGWSELFIYSPKYKKAPAKKPDAQKNASGKM